MSTDLNDAILTIPGYGKQDMATLKLDSQS